MATRQKLINIHSSKPSQKPTKEQIELGEIAVNYADGTEKLYIKNANNEIVGFVNDNDPRLTDSRTPKAHDVKVTGTAEDGKYVSNIAQNGHGITVTYSTPKDNDTKYTLSGSGATVNLKTTGGTASGSHTVTDVNNAYNLNGHSDTYFAKASNPKITGKINDTVSIVDGGNAIINLDSKSANKDYGAIYVSDPSSTADKSRPLVLQNGYGNVGIGVEAPTHKLQVDGNIYASKQVYSNGKSVLTSQTVSKNVVGASDTATKDAVATNGNVHLNHLEDTVVKSSHIIKGIKNATVASDEKGNISISTPDVGVTNDGAGSFIKSIVSTGHGIKYTLGTPPNTNTHLDSNIWAGNSGTAANEAVTSDPYIKVGDSGKYKDQIRFLQGNNVYIKSDASGNVTISAKDTTYITRPNPYALTIKKNDTTITTYDGSSAKIADIKVPTTTKELTNNSGFITSSATVNKANYLTEHDINGQSLKSYYGSFAAYYSGGGNSVTDKPSGVDAFGMITLKDADGYTGQILSSSNANPGLYFRTMTDNTSVDWKKIAFTDDSRFTDSRTPKYHTHPWEQVTEKPATATRWPSWSEVTSKPKFYSRISGDSGTASAEAENDIFYVVTGDSLTSTVSDDGEVDKITITHDNSGVTANNYGQSTNVTGSDGVVVKIPYFTVNAKGHVTSAVDRTVTCRDRHVTNVAYHYTPEKSATISPSSGTVLTGLGVDAKGHVVSATGTNSIANATNATNTTNVAMNDGTVDVDRNIWFNVSSTAKNVSGNVQTASSTNLTFNPVKKELKIGGVKVPTTTEVDSQINAKIAANDAMLFKGIVDDKHALPNSHEEGWTYKVGKAGTYAGKVCEIGDMIICITKRATANNDDWTVLQNNIDGAVTGPTSASDGHFALFNGSTGKIIKNSSYTTGSFVKKSGDAISGNLTFSSGVGILSHNSYYLLKCDGNGAILGPAFGKTYIRSGNEDLIHTKEGSNCTILDSSNSSISENPTGICNLKINGTSKTLYTKSYVDSMTINCGEYTPQ